MPVPSFIGRKYNLSKEDFFETPSYVVEKLLEKEEFRGEIFEPACGTGAISKILIREGFKVISSDIVFRGFGKRQDFFDLEGPVDNIVTNPPYNILNDFILHSLEITRNKVALFLRVSSLEGFNRYNLIYSKKRLKNIYVFSKRVRFNHPKYGKPRGMITYAWFVFYKRFKGIPTLDWIY